MKVILIKDILEDKREEFYEVVERPISVKEFLDYLREKDILPVNTEFLVVKEGRALSEDVLLSDESEVIVLPNLGSPAAIGALVAGIIGGIIAVTAWEATLYAFLVGFAIGSALYTLYYALTHPYKPEVESPTYNWKDIYVTTQAGTPVPIVYGRHRVGGTIIEAYTESHYNTTEVTWTPFVPNVWTQTTEEHPDYNIYKFSTSVLGNTYVKFKPKSIAVRWPQAFGLDILLLRHKDLSWKSFSRGNTFILYTGQRLSTKDDLTDVPIYAWVVQGDKVYLPNKREPIPLTSFSIEQARVEPQKSYQRYAVGAFSAAAFDIAYSSVFYHRGAGTLYVAYKDPTKSAPENPVIEIKSQSSSATATTKDPNKLYVLAAFSEGEINRVLFDTLLVNGQPYQNFADHLTLDYRAGTNDQEPIEGFNEIHSVENVGADLNRQNQSYIWTTTIAVDRLIIRLNFPSGLRAIDRDDGSNKSTSVAVDVLIKEHGQSDDYYVPVYQDFKITANESSEFDFYLEVNGLEGKVYDVKVVRKSGPPSNYYVSYMTWHSIDEIVSEELSYPNTALYAIKALPTENLSGSIPNLSVVVEGVKVLKPEYEWRRPDGTSSGIILTEDQIYYDEYHKEYCGFELSVLYAVSTWTDIVGSTGSDGQPRKLRALYPSGVTTTVKTVMVVPGRNETLDDWTYVVGSTHYALLAQAAINRNAAFVITEPATVTTGVKTWRFDSNAEYDYFNAVLSKLQQQPWFDINELYIIGWDEGGFMVSRLVENFNVFKKAVIHSAGHHSSAHLDSNYNVVIDSLDPPSVSTGHKPTLLISGDCDTKFDFRLSKSYYLALRSKNISADLRVKYDAGHRWFHEFDRDILNFFGLRYSTYKEQYNYLEKTGTWSKQFSRNPAWIVYDLLTNKRYGVGIDESLIDRDSFERAAQHCDTLVPLYYNDSQRGKRFTLDIVIDQASSAIDAVVRLCNLFRASIAWWGGKIRLVVDKPDDVVQVFTMSNIVADSFKETFADETKVYNIANVKFADVNLDYKMNQFQIEDLKSREEDEYIERAVDLDLTGLIDPNMVMRQAIYILRKSQYCTRAISFEAPIEAVTCRPGDLILFQHDVPAWGQGGHILRAGTNWIEINTPVDIVAGLRYRVKIALSSGEILTREVINSPGSKQSILYVDEPFGDKIPEYGDKWVFGQLTIVGKKFRVTSVTLTDVNKVGISAVEHHDEVFEDTYKVGIIVPQYSDLDRVALSVQNLGASEFWYVRKDGTVDVGIRLSWTPPSMSTIDRYEVYRFENDIWILEGFTTNTWFDVIQDLKDGETYTFKVVTKVSEMLRTPIEEAPSVTHLFVGKSEPPHDVTNFKVFQVYDKLYFLWDPVPDRDLDYYEVRKGATWENGERVFRTKDISHELGIFELGQQTYWIKAVDTSGNESINATSVSIYVSHIPRRNPALSFTDSLESGMRENLDFVYYHIESVYRKVLTVRTQRTWEEGNWDEGYWDVPLSTTVAYYYSPIYDLGNISDFSIIIMPEKVVTEGTVSLTYDFRYKVDETSEWSDWQKCGFFVVGRHFQCRVKVELADVESSNAYLHLFKYSVLLNLKEESFSNVYISVDGTYVSFKNSYTTDDLVVIVTPIDNPYVPVVSNITKEGCWIRLYDFNNNSVEGYVNIYIQGY